MRIGELLVEQGKLTARELARAVDEQHHTGRRLCSMLIVRGILAFDDAARALSVQHRVPCALGKHLDHRSLDALTAISAELARTCCALPIGKTRAGALVVCVRDPSEQLAASLARAVGGEVMMVVTPALRIEPLVAAAYGEHGEDFDVELGSVNVPTLPPLPDMDLLDPDSMRAALTDLDDVRVARDPSQSGPLAAPARPSAPVLPRTRTPLPPPPPTLEVTRLALDRATTRDAATDQAISYIAGRWVAGAVLAIRGETAIGYRGHGPLPAPETIALSLSAPSTLQRAVETRRTAIAAPSSEVQDELSRLLGAPTQLTAAPVLVGDHVVAVIAVGQPILGAADLDAATADAGHLAHALGRAYERIHRGS